MIEIVTWLQKLNFRIVRSLLEFKLFLKEYCEVICKKKNYLFNMLFSLFVNPYEHLQPLY
jgi:hypothetical protein